MKLLVLDGNSLVNRAYFGIKLLTTKDGRYTNAIYGFQNILLNLLAAHKPDAVAIAWDERAPTFRHTAYDGYKATRHGMPEELAQQMPVLKELLTDLGFVQVSKAGWEADDILGTLAAACEAAGGTTLLATGDRDSLQLVDDATTVLLATNKETIPMDPAAIREKYGIEPPQLIDVKSLMGDSSDNIPGVPGIGEKTALALISEFGSLQGVYDNIDDKAVKPGQRAKLTANRDKADLSYMLGTIRKDAPIETDPAAYLRQPGDPAAAAQLLAALEMHKLVDRWGLNGGTAPAPSENAAPLETVEPSPLPLLLEGRFYAAQNVTKTGDGSWYLVQGSEVYLPDTDRLAALLDAGHEVCGVFTRRDKPVGRKQILTAPPVKQLAVEHGLSVYQPRTLRDGSSDELIKELAPDIIVVVAYGCIIPPQLLHVAKYGCINLHVSLLPKYRGSAPIQWAVLNGDEGTGVTIMQLDEGLDTGDILMVEPVTIDPEETSGELFDRVSAVGAGTLVTALEKIEAGELTPRKQDNAAATMAPPLTKDMAQFDFTQDAAHIHNWVRGMNPWPVAWFAQDGKRIKVLESRLAENPQHAAPGTVLALKPLTIAAENGAVALLTVTPEGGKPMAGTAWAAGRRLKVGDSL